jgi:hypothetical protein
MSVIVHKINELLIRHTVEIQLVMVDPTYNVSAMLLDLSANPQMGLSLERARTEFFESSVT